MFAPHNTKVAWCEIALERTVRANAQHCEYREENSISIPICNAGAPLSPWRPKRAVAVSCLACGWRGKSHVVDTERACSSSN